MKKIVGIHVDPLGQFVKYLQRYEQILEFNGIIVLRMDSNDDDFWENISKLDAFICRFSDYDVYKQKAKAIIPVVEKYYGIPCFPDMNTSWHYDDKIRQYYIMQKNNLPFVKSWVFWDKINALIWADKAELPLVFKLKGGAGSRNVILIKTRKELTQIINKIFKKGIKGGELPAKDSIAPGQYYKFRYWIYNKMQIAKREFVPYWRLIPNWKIHKNYALFQRFLDKNDFDTRITVIGKRAFGFRRYVRENDFRASGSGNIDYDVDKIDMRCVKIALKVSKTLKFQSMAYDFLYDENQNLKFCEISYIYLDDAIYKCTGYWDENLDWHEGNYWPQYFHLMDLLNLPDLKQPEL